MARLLVHLAFTRIIEVRAVDSLAAGFDAEK